ncbi:hypothetical protein ACSSS7_002171 [Eimeria intestinalis]
MAGGSEGSGWRKLFGRRGRANQASGLHRLAEGSSVRGRSVLQFWKQQLQQQLGGEQQVLHDLLRETRQSALQRLAEAAAAAGANAVVSVRLVTSGLQRMHAEYTAYGTAVRVSKSPHQGTLSPH